MVLEFKIDLVYHESDISDVPIVCVNGEIDVYTSPKLNDTLNKIINSENKEVVLNLEKVHYIDSTGLGIIAHNADMFTNKGGNFKVVCAQPQLRKIFDVSGLSKKNVKLFEAEAQALAQN